MKYAWLALALCVSLASSARADTHPSVVVIGIDGMDPDLLQRFVDAGDMPNVAALMKKGSFSRLETSIPPQSPVAWSNFITGMDPGGHGIYDFIHRDPATYQPTFSAAEILPPTRTLSLGDWILPLAGGETRLLRKGEAFWEFLDRAGVPATLIRVPANYPPSETRSRTLAGMGTPDLLGTYGTFTLFTDNESWRGARVSGGRVVMLSMENDRARAALEGPPNSLRKSEPTLARELVVDVDAGNDAVRVAIDGAEVVLHTGDWSQWVPVSFDLVGSVKRLHGMVRFHLKRASPSLELYASPINIDPVAPALPLSTPADYASDLARETGRYYTQGIAEDTKALEAGVFDDAEFVTLTDTLLAERERMLDVVLRDYRDGFLFYYISTVDQSCHALWRNADPAHPAHPGDGSFADRFRELYRRMDVMLGGILERVPADATVIVMSDHGFAPFYQKVHLNTWLYQNDYLALVRPDEIGQHPLFGNVFWRRTRAYAAGLNGLYVNLAGREGRGIVTPGDEYDRLVNELSAKLLEFRDPSNNERVITTVYRARDVYHGTELAGAPDLIVGYNRGYRSSDDSALGTVTGDLLTPNLGKWTGDHCMDHRLVPGVLISSRPLAVTDPRLVDLPVTILACYGITAPAAMTGRNLFAGAR